MCKSDLFVRMTIDEYIFSCSVKILHPNEANPELRQLSQKF